MTRFEFTLERQLEMIQLVHGIDLQIRPVPTLLATLWERAQADGIELGQLYVLRRSLEPGVGGTYNRASRNIWVAFDEQHPEEAAKCLLHELAHAKRHTGPLDEIDADWDEEAEVFRLARQLAVAWSLDDLLTDEQLEQELGEVERYRELHWAAAYLAGATECSLARAAYSALYMLAGERGWTMQTLEESLHGWHEDESVNAAVLDFPRSFLRASWRLIGDEGGDLGALALPQEEASASLLRSTLRQLAKGSAAAKWQWQRRTAWEADFCFLSLTDSYELTRILATAQAALLAHPEDSALAIWWVYGDSAEAASPRLYRLSVDYGTTVPDAELWVLATPERGRDLVAEAAWQRFIAGWVAPRGQRNEAVVGLRQEPLKDGLQMLWGQMAPSRSDE